MPNPYGITLDPSSVRRAAAESLSETVMAVFCCSHERSVEEVVSKLPASELEQVIKLVARSPGCYPPGILTSPSGRGTPLRQGRSRALGHAVSLPGAARPARLPLNTTFKGCGSSFTVSSA